LSQFVKLRALYGHSSSKKIIAFDTFGKFPEKCLSDDKKYLKSFTNEAGNQSIEKEELLRIYKKLGVDESVELINMSAYSPKGTALVRNVYSFEIS